MSRIECPNHGVVTEGVPFAEHDSYFTRDFEDMVAWIARQMPRTAAQERIRLVDG